MQQLQRLGCGATTHGKAVAVAVARGGGVMGQRQHRLASAHSSFQRLQPQPRRLHTTTAAAAAPQDTAAAAAADAPPTDYFAVDKRPVILYDGVCNMCNGGVNRVLDCDTQGVFRLAALQSGPGRQLLARCGRSPDDLSSIVLVEEHSHYTKSEAVLRIASRLNMPLAVLVPGLSSLLPRPLLDAAYDQIAANRYSVLGRTDTCRVTSQSFEDRFLGA